MRAKYDYKVNFESDHIKLQSLPKGTKYDCNLEKEGTKYDCKVNFESDHIWLQCELWIGPYIIEITFKKPNMIAILIKMGSNMIAM